MTATLLPSKPQRIFFFFINCTKSSKTFSFNNNDSEKRKKDVRKEHDLKI